MTYDDAIERDDVSITEAVRELRKHGIYADFNTDDGYLFDTATGEPIAFADRHNEFTGASILDWLGY